MTFTPCIWLLILLGRFVCGALIAKDVPTIFSDGDLPCKARDWNFKGVLGGLMLEAGLLDQDTLARNDLNNDSSVDFSFLKPVLVRGWTVKGREGGLFGPYSKRRGYVASYVVTFLGKNKDVAVVEDPKSGGEEFVSDGNLARPEEVTVEKLDEPLMTSALRLTPVIWSGVPYLDVRLYYCAKDEDLTTEQRLDEIVEESETVKNVLAENAESEEELEQSPHPHFAPCVQPAAWRYADKTTPVDRFWAVGNPHQAWRAVLGLDYVPYLFPSYTNTPMLEVIFAGKSRVDAVKVAGLGVEEGGGEEEEEEEAWGVVTQFHLLYKDPKTDKWLYYADSSGKARVFGADEPRDPTTANKALLYQLPIPISTGGLGFFPLDWANRPYLAVDLLACYTQRVGPESEEKERELTPTAIEDISVTKPVVKGKQGKKKGKSLAKETKRKSKKGKVKKGKSKKGNAQLEKGRKGKVQKGTQKQPKFKKGEGGKGKVRKKKGKKTKVQRSKKKKTKTGKKWAQQGKVNKGKLEKYKQGKMQKGKDKTGKLKAEQGKKAMAQKGKSKKEKIQKGQTGKLQRKTAPKGKGNKGKVQTGKSVRKKTKPDKKWKKGKGKTGTLQKKKQKKGKLKKVSTEKVGKGKGMKEKAQKEKKGKTKSGQVAKTKKGQKPKEQKWKAQKSKEKKAQKGPKGKVAKGKTKKGMAKKGKKAKAQKGKVWKAVTGKGKKGQVQKGKKGKIQKGKKGKVQKWKGKKGIAKKGKAGKVQKGEKGKIQKGKGKTEKAPKAKGKAGEVQAGKSKKGKAQKGKKAKLQKGKGNKWKAQKGKQKKGQVQKGKGQKGKKWKTQKWKSAKGKAQKGEKGKAQKGEKGKAQKGEKGKVQKGKKGKVQKGKKGKVQKGKKSKGQKAKVQKAKKGKGKKAWSKGKHGKAGSKQKNKSKKGKKKKWKPGKGKKKNKKALSGDAFGVCGGSDSSLLAVERGARVIFRELRPQQVLLTNRTRHATVLLPHGLATVTALRVMTPTRKVREREVVQRFMVKYMDPGTHVWTLLKGLQGSQPEIFHPQNGLKGDTLPLPIPIVTSGLQFIPQVWRGASPEMQVDVIGC